MFSSKGYAPKVSTVVSHGYTAPALGSYKKYIEIPPRLQQTSY